jgi:MFS family permease
MTHSTAAAESTRAHRRSRQRSRPPIRPWLIAGAIAVVFVAGLIGVLDGLLLVPITAALAAATARAGRPIARSGLTVAVAVTMAVGYLAFAGALAGLPYLSSAAVTPVLIALQVVAMLLVALPLAMPVPDERAVAVGRRDLIAATAGLLVLTLAHNGGVTYLLLAGVAIAVPVVLALSRYLRPPIQAPARRARIAWAVAVVAFAALLAATTLPGTFDTLAVFGPFSVTAVRFGIVGLALVAAVLGCLPARRVPLATNALALVTAVFLAVQLIGAYRLPAGAVTLSAPFAGEWYVVNGGHAEIVNNHRGNPSQREALDIVSVSGGRTSDAGRSGLDAYYAFGEPLLAPADGTVVSVSDELADRPAGSPDPDPDHAEGNEMVLDIGGGRYVVLAHLQRHSAVVLVGDRVRDGQALARVGNTGNTDEPHLHIQVQDSPRTDIHHAGVDSYPILFRDVVLVRGGSGSRPAGADLRRGDFFRATTR